MVAVDSARRLGVTAADLDAAVSAMRSWPHVSRAREAIELSRPRHRLDPRVVGSDGGGGAGYGRPQTQFGLAADGRAAWADLRLGRHLFELDGQNKYLPEDAGGLARVPPAEVLWMEKQRQDWFLGFHLGMSRLVWADMFGKRREQAKARILREYLETCRRFGTDIDDLTPYLARGPRPRPQQPFLRRAAS